MASEVIEKLTDSDETRAEAKLKALVAHWCRVRLLGIYCYRFAPQKADR
jgi:hypothetical protein